MHTVLSQARASKPSQAMRTCSPFQTGVVAPVSSCIAELQHVKGATQQDRCLVTRPLDVSWSLVEVDGIARWPALAAPFETPRRQCPAASACLVDYAETHVTHEPLARRSGSELIAGSSGGASGPCRPSLKTAEVLTARRKTWRRPTDEHTDGK